jgi:hypothetical protein
MDAIAQRPQIALPPKRRNARDARSAATPIRTVVVMAELDLSIAGKLLNGI